jgi:hypothetical protein
MNIYEIRVEGHLDQSWSSWFDGLTISYDRQDNTVLRGPLVDEAALHGVLIKVRDLALPLLALLREDADGPAQEGTVSRNTGKHDGSFH